MIRRLALTSAVLIAAGILPGVAQAAPKGDLSVGPYLVNPESCPPVYVYDFSFEYQNGESLGPLAPAAGCIGTPGTADATSPSGQHQAVTVTQTPANAGQPTSVGIVASLSKATGTASPLTKMAIRLPPGMARNYGEFVTCPTDQLIATASCPTESRIGSGSTTAVAPPLVPEVHAAVSIWNGTDGSVLLYLIPDIGPNQLVGGVPSADGTLVFSVPAIVTLPGEPNATLTEIALNLGATGSGQQRPKLTVRARKKQKLGRLSISLTVDERATVRLTGAMRFPGASRRLRFRTLKKSVSANKRTTLKPRLSRRNRKRVNRTLRRSRKLTARFKIKATDVSGDSSSKSVKVQLKR